ncbi:hypothetical protein EAG_15289 [Camponotus floridanus]|uniref:Uncharacterized protein n=1 Tax=Camponotus floridanus TaxID=104421 RepID=E1ZW89_CAMFO|nr:hypothetical protein EAG_15289 [Camponotus floridanus]
MVEFSGSDGPAFEHDHVSWDRKSSPGVRSFPETARHYFCGCPVALNPAELAPFRGSDVRFLLIDLPHDYSSYLLSIRKCIRAAAMFRIVYLNDEVKRISRKSMYGEIAAGGHQGLKARPRSRDTATTHAACFISSPLRPAPSLVSSSKSEQEDEPRNISWPQEQISVWLSFANLRRVGLWGPNNYIATLGTPTISGMSRRIIEHARTTLIRTPCRNKGIAVNAQVEKHALTACVTVRN